MEELDAEQRDKLLAAMARPKEDIPGTVVAKVVTNWGFRLTADSVQRHRKGDCACP
jgi:hypothetical protein